MSPLIYAYIGTIHIYTTYRYLVLSGQHTGSYCLHSNFHRRKASQSLFFSLLSPLAGYLHLHVATSCPHIATGDWQCGCPILSLLPTLLRKMGWVVIVQKFSEHPNTYACPAFSTLYHQRICTQDTYFESKFLRYQVPSVKTAKRVGNLLRTAFLYKVDSVDYGPSNVQGISGRMYVHKE